MASATVEVVNIKTVKIVLSEDEAQTLLDITNKVGGCHETSQRRHVDSIRRALVNAGLVRSSYNAKGSINF
jgi:hypothetical protein